MKASYLVYLAEVGAANIHPLRQQATTCLVDALNPRPDQHLLEVGCGTAGTMTRLILEKKVRVDGVEILWPMLRVGQRRLRLSGARARATLTCASGTQLPMASACYDAVYTESVLGYQEAKSAGAMLREIRRVLKPGRRYVANEAIWKREIDPATAAAIHYAGVADFGLSQASPQAWSVDEWISLMEDSGFNLQAADLLHEKAEALPPTRLRDRPWQLHLSATLTALFRLRGWLIPRLLRQKWRYRRRLARHTEDGHYLESRLFVLVAR